MKLISSRPNLTCPKCNSLIKLKYDMDWDACQMRYFPICKQCGFSTSFGFEFESEVARYLKFFKEFEDEV